MFASGSRDAWQLLQDVVPVAVVVDMRAGSAGGFGLLRDMSQAIALSDVPSLMLIERAQDAWLAEQAGATIYRVKPVDPSELITDTMSMFPATVGD
jgi:DNA-binding response OmpR family regulator